MLAEACLGDVITGDGDQVQAVAGRQVVREHAIAGGGDQDGGTLVEEVEEEAVQEGGDTVCDE